MVGQLAVTRMSEAEFLDFVLADPEGRTWELWEGELREKPGMSSDHNWRMFYLGHLLQLQLNVDEYHARVNAGFLPRPETSYYIPDVAVIPVAMEREQDHLPGSLELYRHPLPLVVELWSPSTGRYDVDVKLADYQRRGDAEIWRLHPFERTVRVWTRQPDGSYAETLHREGTIRLAALPDVTIDLALLFR